MSNSKYLRPRGKIVGTYGGFATAVALSTAFLFGAPDSALAVCDGINPQVNYDATNGPDSQGNYWFGNATNAGVANGSSSGEFGCTDDETTGNVHFGTYSLRQNGGAVQNNFVYDQNGSNNVRENTGDANNNTVFGNNNVYQNGTDTDNTASGNFVSGSNSIRGNDADANNNVVFGDNSLRDNAGDTNGNIVFGNNSGKNAFGSFTNNLIFGDNSGERVGDGFNGNMIFGDASGNDAGENVDGNTVFGSGSGNFYGDGSTGNFVFGNNAGNNVTGSNNIAFGNGAGNINGTANYTMALGTNTLATSSGGVAIGTDSTGAGAQTTRPDQMVLGTSMHTYTAPGITSYESASYQEGPLAIVTTDASGNLASDGGATFSMLADHERRINQNQDGVALALAVENPDLKGNENFGVMVNWGTFEGSNAVGLSAIGTLWEGNGSRVSLAGGVGFTGDTVGGRAGVAITW